jgi:hypothetical protein
LAWAGLPGAGLAFFGAAFDFTGLVSTTLLESSTRL